MDNRIAKIIKQILPSPFSIAIVLTIVIIMIALVFTDKNISEIASFWEKGLCRQALSGSNGSRVYQKETRSRFSEPYRY